MKTTSPVKKAIGKVRSHQHGTLTSIEHKEGDGKDAPPLTRVEVRHGPKPNSDTSKPQPWPQTSTLHMSPSDAQGLQIGQRVKVGCTPVNESEEE